MTATEIAPYTAGIEQYRAGIVMTPEQARAQDDQLRACMTAVLREGTDYGVIPGTSGEKALYKPGAEKLLQWFGLGFTNDRQEIERDDDGRREGVTYRATITRQLPDGRIIAVATCEGYAGYDEPKYYQTAEEMRAKAEEKERYWAHKDRRPPNPTRWQAITADYRAPWHTLLMMAQKRALVGAAKDATAASGLFPRGDDEPASDEGAKEEAAQAGNGRQQQSEDGWPDGATARRAQPQGSGQPWIDGAIEEAASFKTEAAGQKLWRDAATAARDGLCTPDQATHVQNLITARIADRRKDTATRILKSLDGDDPWRGKILEELSSDEEARGALAEVQQLVGAGTLDDDRGKLLGRAVIARFPKAALAGEPDG